MSKGPNIGHMLDSVEALTVFAREHGPGQYDVDVHSLEPFPGSNVSAKSWGKVIHQPDGRIDMQPIRWPAVTK
jgi:hypothetical protein